MPFFELCFFLPLQENLPRQRYQGVKRDCNQENVEKIMRHKVADGMKPLHQKMSAEVGDGGEEELSDDPAVFPFLKEKPSQSENEKALQG